MVPPEELGKGRIDVVAAREGEDVLIDVIDKMTATPCDAHHLDSWTFDGGGTAVKRMLLLCDKHHRLVHEGGWRLVERDGGRFDLAPPWDRPPD